MPIAGFDVIGDPAGDNQPRPMKPHQWMILRAAGIPVRPAPTNDPLCSVSGCDCGLDQIN